MLPHWAGDRARGDGRFPAGSTSSAGVGTTGSMSARRALFLALGLLALFWALYSALESYGVLVAPGLGRRGGGSTAIGAASGMGQQGRGQRQQQQLGNGRRVNLTQYLDSHWHDPEICKEAPRACTCLPPSSNPEVVVYNRVPKCGSTSLYEWMAERLREKCATCSMCVDHDHLHRMLGEHDAAAFVEDPYHICRNGGTQGAKNPSQQQQTGRKPSQQREIGVVVSHQFYIPPRTQAQRDHLAYLAVVRDTPSRCRSRFHYEHDTLRILPPPGSSDGADLDAFVFNDTLGPKVVPTWKANSNRLGTAASMQTIIDLVREECFSNYNTRWFCGAQDVCKEGGQRMLQEAKRVLAEEYAMVGVYPAIAETAWLLNTLMRTQFGEPETMSYYEEHVGCAYCGASIYGPARPAAALRNHARSAHVTPPSHPPLTQAQRAEIDRRNPLDAELFEYARRLFSAKMHACLGSAA